MIIDGPGRFDGVAEVGVDERAWRHTRRGDKYVTMIIDLTAVRAGTGPAELLDVVEGRSKQIFKTWLAGCRRRTGTGIEVVAMDVFTGFKTTTAEELPDAVAGRVLLSDASSPAAIDVGEDGVEPPVDPGRVVSAPTKTPGLLEGLLGQVLGGHRVDPEPPGPAHQALPQDW